MLDGSGHPRALVETTAVEVVAFSEVGEDHARDEGEGGRTLEHWRRVHADFFAGSAGGFDPGHARGAGTVQAAVRPVVAAGSSPRLETTALEGGGLVALAALAPRPPGGGRPLVEVRGPPGPTLETPRGGGGGLVTLAALAPRPAGGAVATVGRGARAARPDPRDLVAICGVAWGLVRSLARLLDGARLPGVEVGGPPGPTLEMRGDLRGSRPGAELRFEHRDLAGVSTTVES